jgi:hypothetical protein
MEGIGYGRKRLIEKIVKLNWNKDEKTMQLLKFSYDDVMFIINEMLQEEGKPYFEETHETMRGHYVFRYFVKHLIYRNLANYDSMILLTSEKGSGKSSAAMMIAKEWCAQIGIKFNPKRHIAYTNHDMMTRIEQLNHFEPLIADESIKFALASEWAKRENKELRKKLAVVRTKHLLFILCFPLKISKMEKTYLESFVSYWCDLYARGRGIIYIKDKNPTQDSWRLSTFKDIGNFNEFTPQEKIKNMVSKHPNFWQVITFPKPSKRLYDAYLKVREKNVYDQDSVLKNVAKEDIYNALLVLSLRDIMVNDMNFTMNRVIMHVKNNYDINLSKQMIQDAVDDAQQLIQKIREEALQV